MRVFLLGYPGDMGGANTEAWHTIKLWRNMGVDVDLIPTWGEDKKWEERLNSIGCKTHHLKKEEFHRLPELPGSTVVGMCNSNVLEVWDQLREINCKIVWVNCMTFLFQNEMEIFRLKSPPDVMVYQSQFQRSQLEPNMKAYGMKPDQGHLIRGCFNWEDWEFNPLPHKEGKPFVFGRIARPSPDKWSPSLWPIYHRVQYPHKRVRLLGVNQETEGKIGFPPNWGEHLAPMAEEVPDFLSTLHCILTVNGGARENWPRVGLEAMAAGVPVVAQDAWGWKEMIEHGETGFLGGTNEELSHYTATLAYDESLRMKIVKEARERLEDELANPTIIGRQWMRIFDTIWR